VKQLIVKSQNGADTDRVTLTVGSQPTKDTDEMINLLMNSPAVLGVEKV
jgi:hypothetical protein